MKHNIHPHLKALFLIALILFLLLQYRIWLSSQGLPGTFFLAHQIAAQQQHNNELTVRNDTLRATLDHFKTDKDLIETRAREDLGMIKPGEVFYQFLSS